MCFLLFEIYFISLGFEKRIWPIFYSSHLYSMILFNYILKMIQPIFRINLPPILIRNIFFKYWHKRQILIKCVLTIPHTNIILGILILSKSIFIILPCLVLFKVIPWIFVVVVIVILGLIILNTCLWFTVFSWIYCLYLLFLICARTLSWNY